MKTHIVMRWHKYILGHQQQQHTKGQAWFFTNKYKEKVPVRLAKATVACSCYKIWEFE